MTERADLIFRNGEVHTLTPGDEVTEAVAVRDGEIVRVDEDYEVDFLEGVDTRVVDLDGRVLLPGLIDAHTHMESAGQYLVHADLSAAESREDALDRLAARAAETDDEWVRGYGYDESTWPAGEYLTREDLDSVTTDRPVVAYRVDMHTASLNSAALAATRSEMPDDQVHTAGGEPTGVVVEDAVGAVRDATAAGVAETRRLLEAARDRAHELGVTGVHELVRDSHAPRVYRELAARDELNLRVRVNYWADHLDAVIETGLRTNDGGEMVRVGGIKTFTDGSIGARTAKLFEPYRDGEASSEHATGEWVVDPEELNEIVDRAHEHGLQVCAHAIGDHAIEAALSAFEDAVGRREGATGADGHGDGADPLNGVADDPRHRIEHVELATDEQFERMAEAGVVASMQPNFLQWAGDDGLYDRRLGETRSRGSNRLRVAHETGVALAFGSDCMPLDPLLGVDHAVTARDEAQRLSVTEALRGYTRGAAYAGFDEDRLGTVEVGNCADLVVLEASPWETEAVAEIDVATTVVDGEIVYER
jgi:hypothetical protein